jgi:chromosome partitioning protein
MSMPSTNDVLSTEAAPIMAMAGLQSGAGKTQAALYVAAGLAAEGARVLLIDTDPQNSIALSLGISLTDLTAFDSRCMTLGGAMLKGAPLYQCAGTDNPAVIYAGHEVPMVDFATLAKDSDPELALDRIAARLGALRATHDYILIDCAPTLSTLTAA